MILSNTDLSDITVRLEKLESENLRLKRLACLAMFAGALPIAALILARGGPIFAQRANQPLRTIVAYQYILQDSRGRTRAELSFSDTKGSPMLSFSGPRGRTRLLISADDMGTQIVTYSPGGGAFQTKMTSFADGSLVQASHFDRGTPLGDASLFALQHATNLEAEDSKNYRTIVGKANFIDPATGKTERTNAASIVMEELGRLIWKAPPAAEAH